MVCMHKLFNLFACLALTVCTGMTAEYDTLIRNGLIYDGSGRPPRFQRNLFNLSIFEPASFGFPNILQQVFRKGYVFRQSGGGDDAH